MPTIEFDGVTVNCEAGENLRTALMRTGLPLYNGIARQIHCRGLGTCGTCAVEVTCGGAGDQQCDVSARVTPTTAVERWRLAFPPHQTGSALRLACQCRILDDVKLKKYRGLWGHRTV